MEWPCVYCKKEGTRNWTEIKDETSKFTVIKKICEECYQKFITDILDDDIERERLGSSYWNSNDDSSEYDL